MSFLDNKSSLKLTPGLNYSQSSTALNSHLQKPFYLYTYPDVDIMIRGPRGTENKTCIATPFLNHTHLSHPLRHAHFLTPPL